MREPKAFRCANCGQMLPISHTGISKCKYCGTEYQVDDDWAAPIRIEMMQFRTATFSEKVKIPLELMMADPEKAVEFSLHEMAERMAERIIPCMEIYAEKDLYTFDTFLGARIRVAVPDESIEKALQKAIAVNAETVKGEKV